jgi:hypothetical protein
MTRKVLALFVACMLLSVWPIFPVFADKPRDGITIIIGPRMRYNPVMGTENPEQVSGGIESNALGCGAGNSLWR